MVGNGYFRGLVLKKGEVVSVQFGSGMRYGIVVSTALFNESFGRLYFVPADERTIRHKLEVVGRINKKTYAFQPENLISISTGMKISSLGPADSALVEEVCKRVRLIMDLG